MDTRMYPSGGPVIWEVDGQKLIAKDDNGNEILRIDAGNQAFAPPTVADDNTEPGLPVLHRIVLGSGADADHDVTLTYKTRVIDAWVAMKGAGTGGSTVTVKNGSTAISDALDVASAGDKDILRIGEIDDAQHEIAAAGTLRVSTASTSADFAGAECYVLGVRVS